MPAVRWVNKVFVWRKEVKYERATNHSSYSSLRQGSWCYDNFSQSAVLNAQPKSTIHSFLDGLIDRERFTHSEAEVSVSSQLTLSVQGHSTPDRPVPPRDLGWDNAARHASGALLQGPTSGYISTGHSKDKHRDTKKPGQTIQYP